MTSRGRVRSVRTHPEEGGVTLLELMVALSLLALVLGGIYGFVATGGQSARVTNSFLQTQAQVRAALDNIVDETRWAQSVTAASATSVTLLMPSGTPFSASTYAVTFAYDAAADTVTRREDPDGPGPQPPGPAVPLAFSIVREDGNDGLTFRYFDGLGADLGTAPANPSSITRVRLSVTSTRDQVSRTFASNAALHSR